MRSLTTIDSNYSEEVLKTDRLFQDLNHKHFESLAKDEKQLNEIKLILSEYDYIKYSSLEVPSTLTLEDMKQLLLFSRNKRIQYFYHLFNKEIKRLVKTKRKLIDKQLKEIELKSKWSQTQSERSGLFDAYGDLVYGINNFEIKNIFFLFYKYFSFSLDLFLD
jgi:hypothetical protein